ncbi:transmembrane protein 132D [Salminus brasiliensis]|uniref:transmembrane protein 132D n=1 Tax=Salminus brasiliensis TaxID=930266 RepID=UPI003B82E0B1
MVNTGLLPRGVLLLMAACLATVIQGLKSEQSSDDPKTLYPETSPELTYQILNADHLFLRDTSQVLKGNLQRSQKQTFIITGLTGQPAINVSYGPMSVEQAIPSELLNVGPRVRAFILARQVRSSAPIIRLLFNATSKADAVKDVSDRVRPGQSEAGYICVTAHAFWALLEIRTTCSIPANGGFCLVHLKPEPGWFSPGSSRSSREQRGDSRGTTVELYYQTRPSPTSQCVAQDSNQWKGADQVFGPNMKKIGNVNLLRSPPGNPTFMRLRLGGTVIVQTSSKPLKNADTATFYVFLSSTSPVEHFILRATVRRGLSFSTARPSDPQLWDIALDPGRGSDPQTISVICQKKSAFTGKRGLLEVLQLDFETQEQGDHLESQMIAWRLELPGNMIRDEGTMKIYTIQKDYVGIVPHIMSTELLNTAVLTGKRVSVPVRVLGVEADGSVTDITNSTRCRSADEDTLKVSERCESLYMSGEETRGRVKMLVNFTYSYLSVQLEVSVWMPHLPLQIDMSDQELSQIKGWRVPVFGAKRPSWDSEEDDEKKGRGCMLQYQHSLVRVLTAFTAEAPDSSGSSLVKFLGPEWLVDVTGLVRYSLRVGDTSIARLQAGTVLSGRAAGVTTVQVMSPLSDAVLAERMVRVLDDKVSITELGVQLVSGLSVKLQLTPGSNRAIAATTTTQDTMHNPKQEAVVACWVKFSDGSQTPLDLFDPSGYTLTLSSLDKKVVSVRTIPGRVVVAEAEGQGLLLRAELAICEACQKSKRKSKLAVGAGTVRVKFLSAEQPAGESGRIQAGVRGMTDYGTDTETVDSDRKLFLTSSSGLVEIFRNTIPGMQESSTREISTTSTKSSLQEAIGAAVSTIRAMNGRGMSATKPGVDKALVTVGPGNVLKKNFGNLMDSLDFPSQELPKEDPSLVESDLVRTFGFFTDLEICIYSLVGVSCLAIIAILLNCATHNAKSRSKKSPVQCQGPDEHKHHWVRLGTAAEQSRDVPIATTQVPSAAAEMPRSMEMQKPMERPIVTEMPRAREMPAVPCEERTATLGRRSNTLPPRPDPMAVRSATLLPKPIRSDPLHSPTSKRNQVQFTTFTTLDIKHLAALKRNGMNYSWASQEAGGVNQSTGASQAMVASQGGLCSQTGPANQVGLCSQTGPANQAGLCSQIGRANQGVVRFQLGGCTPAGDCTVSKGFLPESPWPVVKPVAQV